MLVVDGGSTDRTRDARRASTRPSTTGSGSIDNPRRIPPAALNEAVRAHAVGLAGPHRRPRHRPARLRRAGHGASALRATGAASAAARTASGSPTRAGPSPRCWARRSASATRRTTTAPTSQTVDHIPFGAYPRAVIEKVGGWDESIPVNQDFEFDHRVREAGHELLFDPSLVIAWEVRPTVRAVLAPVPPLRPGQGAGGPHAPRVGRRPATCRAGAGRRARGRASCCCRSSPVGPRPRGARTWPVSWRRPPTVPRVGRAAARRYVPRASRRCTSAGASGSGRAWPARRPPSRRIG